MNDIDYINGLVGLIIISVIIYILFTSDKKSSGTRKELESEPPTPTPTALLSDIELTFDLDLASLDIAVFADTVLADLASSLGVGTDDVELISVRAGSVIVTVRLTPAPSAALLEAFSSGTLGPIAGNAVVAVGTTHQSNVSPSTLDTSDARTMSSSASAPTPTPTPETPTPTVECETGEELIDGRCILVSSDTDIDFPDIDFPDVDLPGPYNPCVVTALLGDNICIGDDDGPRDREPGEDIVRLPTCGDVNGDGMNGDIFNCLDDLVIVEPPNRITCDITGCTSEICCAERVVSVDDSVDDEDDVCYYQIGCNLHNIDDECFSIIDTVTDESNLYYMCEIPHHHTIE